MSPEVSPEYAEFRRRKILEAAWHSFAENGVRGTTMRGIAKRLGLSTGILYTYFRNKEEIVAALDEMATEQNRLLLAELEREPTAREALEGLFDYLLQACPEAEFRRSAQANLTSWYEALRTPNFGLGFTRSRKQLETALVSIIRRGIDRKELADDLVPEAAAAAILATVFGVQVQVALIAGLDTPALLRSARDLVLGGLPWRG